MSESPFVCWLVPFLSPTGLLSMGGPIVGTGTVMVDGVKSMGSRGGVNVDAPVEEGSMGMDLWRL